MLTERHHAAQRREAVMHGIDRAARGSGGDGREQRRDGDAEAHFLAFHIAAGQCSSRSSEAKAGLPAASAQ